MYAGAGGQMGLTGADGIERGAGGVCGVWIERLARALFYGF
jgi:hypothetical protein